MQHYEDCFLVEYGNCVHYGTNTVVVSMIHVLQFLLIGRLDKVDSFFGSAVFKFHFISFFLVSEPMANIKAITYTESIIMAH